MFNEIDIAYKNKEVVLSTSGHEYEIVSDNNATVLVLDALMNQLKLNTVHHGYALFDEAPIVLKEMPTELELVDTTVRFNKQNMKVYSVNDIYMYQLFLSAINSSFTLGEVYVKWGRKATVYVDCFAFSGSNNYSKEWSTQFQPSDADLEVLTQRFKILLNHSFLNKLKSYTALWSKKYHANYILPEWFHELYKLN